MTTITVDHLTKRYGATTAPGRVGEVLDLVGLAGAARRAGGGYSPGMRRRLGLAAAPLGELTAAGRSTLEDVFLQLTDPTGR